MAWKSINGPLNHPVVTGATAAALHLAGLSLLVELAEAKVTAAAACVLLAGWALQATVTPLAPRHALRTGLDAALALVLLAWLLHTFALHYLLAQALAMLAVWGLQFVGKRWALQDCPRCAADSRWRFAPFVQLGPTLIALVVVVRLLSLGAYPLVDPTESRYAEIARKMLETGNWITPQIEYGVWFWSKPPLAMWLNALGMALFGVNEFATRLSALALAVGMVCLVHRLARSRHNGAEWAAPTVLVSLLLFFVLAGSVAVEQALSFGVTLSMTAFWLALRGDRPVFGWLFFVGLALGVLAKGLVVLALCGGPLLLWLTWQRAWATARQQLPWRGGLALLLALTLPWYALAEVRTPGFLHYFFIGEHWQRWVDANWQGAFYADNRHHARGLVCLYWLLGSLPWSPVLLVVVGRALWQRQGQSLWASADGWRGYCLLWMLAPLLAYAGSATAIWTCILPGLPGLALLLADWRQERRLPWFPSDRHMARLALLLPVILLGLIVAWQVAPLQLVRTQKPLVEQYLQLRHSNTEKLVYLHDNPFSAQFYTLGQSAELANVEEFQTVVEQPGRDYYVCPQRQWPDMPDAIKDRLQVVGLHGGFLLLRRTGQR